MSKQYRFTSRTKARKRAADVVYEADQRGMGRDGRVLRDLLRERRVVTAALTPLPDYSVRVIEGVADNLRRIDSLLEAHAKVAGLDRIPAVDLAVMRVATWEMLENAEDVPRPVAIDEAISIVKSISTDSSASFVNAVLDAVRKDIESPAWSRERVGVGESGPVASEVDDAVSADEVGVDVDEALALADEILAEVADEPALAAPSGISRALDEEDDAAIQELDELLDEY